MKNLLKQTCLKVSDLFWSAVDFFVFNPKIHIDNLIKVQRISHGAKKFSEISKHSHLILNSENYGKLLEAIMSARIFSREYSVNIEIDNVNYTVKLTPVVKKNLVVKTILQFEEI